MATYAIGDVQGCWRSLNRLLDHLRFDAGADRLWFVGDLVNRGPDSLEVVRFVRSLGDGAVTVLGNHDLHLLAVAAGARPARRRDTLGKLLAAADRDELIAWLRRRPLFHRDPSLGYSMVHAGIPPPWDRTTVAECAREVEATLAGGGATAMLEQMYGDEPAAWDAGLDGMDRSRFIVNGLTRMRYCSPAGHLILDEKRPPGSQGPDCIPWFEVPARRWSGERLLFGHWAALEPPPALARERGLHHLDTGCVWGGRLTALRLEDGRTFRVDCAEAG